MIHQPAHRKGVLAGVLVLMGVLSLVPARYGRWANSLGNAAQLVTAPVTQPIHQTTSWLMGSPGAADQNALAAAQRERDHFRTLWLQEQSRVRDLEGTIVQLQRGALASELPVTQLMRKVIGGSSDGSGGQLQIRSGSRDGTEVNTVVTTGGVQLVGKVVRVSSRVSEARLITASEAGKITGVIMLPGEVRGPKVLLHPVGEGRLQGLVEYSGSQAV
jgi:cell shape-determining protein MreC